jgi:hypothetical protein
MSDHVGRQRARWPSSATSRFPLVGSDMQGGPVDELPDVAVERPVLDGLQVEVGRTLKDRVVSV